MRASINPSVRQLKAKLLPAAIFRTKCDTGYDTHITPQHNMLIYKIINQEQHDKRLPHWLQKSFKFTDKCYIVYR